MQLEGITEERRANEKMMEIQLTTTVTVKEDGEIITEVRQAAGAPDNENNTAAGYTIYSDDEETTEAEAERYAVTSDLANVCEYLEDSEVIKIKLIIQKAKARKERTEHE